MSEIPLHIDRWAPTGEGVARWGGKVVFVEGAIPGEDVEALLFDQRPRHARASVTAVRVPSPDRRDADAHAAACGGADWAHVALGAARSAKRELFRETMRRLGGIEPELFGDLPISSSGLEYRLRNQFHADNGPAGWRVGFFARRSHRVVPLDGCEIVSAKTREKIAAMAEASAFSRPGRVDSVESVEIGAEHRLAVSDEQGRPGAGCPRAVDIHVGHRPFRVSTGSFFQVNRHRIGPFFDRIRDLSADCGVESALDAYAGVGYLSQALVEAGARVIAVESSRSSAADARINRERLGGEGRLDLRHERIERFLLRQPALVDLVIADPPRGGLKDLARPLAACARRRLIYVSCEPASLARDLKTLLGSGFEIEAATLEDFFVLTHRVEAVVVLKRR
jgi:23S rRNA (uracil1939-C5)-methyltransferase